MQQVSSMTNELRSADGYICMYIYASTNTHTSEGNLFEKKLHTDDAVCGAIGIDKKISRTVHLRQKTRNICSHNLNYVCQMLGLDMNNQEPPFLKISPKYIHTFAQPKRRAKVWGTDMYILSGRSSSWDFTNFASTEFPL